MSDRSDLVQPHPINIPDRLDMLSWDLARAAAARIRELEARVEDLEVEAEMRRYDYLHGE